MTELLIGAGGWAYFQVPGLGSLEAYSKAFNFVEVNSTFYEIPSLDLVKSWRQKVPLGFGFSVRCHKNVTHRYHLEPVEEAFNVFGTMIDVAKILNSRFLVLETPSSLLFSDEKIKSIRDFFESVDFNGVRIVWEARGSKSKHLQTRLGALMQDCNIIQCVDVSKETPTMKSDTVYTRVFGKGRHNLYQFTDEEILSIDRKVTSGETKTGAVSFHNVRMYKDAARYKIFRETGRFPSVTGVKGQRSLEKVIMEDPRFPATKQELLRDHGWKIVDLAGEKRVHACTLLENLPDRKFGSIEEVMKSSSETL